LFCTLPYFIFHQAALLATTVNTQTPSPSKSSAKKGNKLSKKEKKEEKALKKKGSKKEKKVLRECGSLDGTATVGNTSALVTLICALFCVAPQVVQVL
jgi:hypothetical protein